MENDHFLNN